jgi:hypothetical protein
MLLLLGLLEADPLARNHHARLRVSEGLARDHPCNRHTFSWHRQALERIQ